MRLLFVPGLMLMIAPAVLNAANDLKDVYQAGLTNDPRYRSAWYEYEAAREAAPQAMAALLPTARFDMRVADNSQEIFGREQVDIFNPTGGLGKSSYQSNSFSFQVSQPLFRLDTWVGLSQARASERQAYAAFAAAEQDLILRCAEAYLTVLSARDGVDFSRAEQAAVGRQLELVQARRRGGLANVTDEYEAQARYSLVEADVVLATYLLDDAYQALREVVGDAVSDVYPLKPEIPLRRPEPADAASWIDKSLEQNLTLMARMEAAGVAEHEVRRRRAGHYPTVDLVLSHGSSDTLGAVSGSDSEATAVSLQFSIPIYSGGSLKSQTHQAAMIHRRTQEELKLQHRIVMREARAAYQGVNSAISRVNALRQSLRSQKSALDGRIKGYRSGVSTLLDVLDAERNLYLTRRDLSRARYDYLLNMLRLKQQAGTLDEIDLQYIDELLDRSAAEAVAGG